MLVVGGLALIVIGCAGAEDPQVPAVPQATVDPETPQAAGELEIPPYPEEYVLKVAGDVEIRFAHPSGLIDWTAPIFIHHFSSSSRVLLDREGRVTNEIINGSEAASAICAVLSDDVLIAEVISRAAEIKGALVMFNREPLDPGPCNGVE